MESKGLEIYFLKCRSSAIVTSKAPLKEIFGITPSHLEAFLGFENEYNDFKKIIVDAPTMDLVIFKGNVPIRGLEIKLTAVPDKATSNKEPTKQGPEIVLRQPTIKFLAASICKHYSGSNKANLRRIVGKRFQNIIWEDEQSFLSSFNEVKDVLQQICQDIEGQQVPLIIQPIWRTIATTLTLDESCFDVVTWSDMAFLQLILNESAQDVPPKANRIDRTIAWLGVLISRYVNSNYFHSADAISKTTYGTKNDKAFALGGSKMNKYLPNEMLDRPRIPSTALKEILIGDGINFLSPERRLDAAILGTWGNL